MDSQATHAGGWTSSRLRSRQWPSRACSRAQRINSPPSSGWRTASLPKPMGAFEMSDMAGSMIDADNADMLSSIHGQGFTLDAQELARRERASESVRAWWSTVPRCAACNRFGARCGQPVAEPGLLCRWHGPATVKKPRKVSTAVGEARAPSREHGRVMRKVWRLDPWALGYTVRLDAPGEAAFALWLRAHDLGGDCDAPDQWLPDSVVDWCRWKLRGLLLQGSDVRGGEGSRLADQVRERMAALGPPQESYCDMREQSHRQAWRVRSGAKADKPYTQPVAGHGRRVVPVPPTALARPAKVAREWRPLIGPARLDAAELRELEHALERDRVWGEGDAQVRQAQERIELERARRLFG